MKVKDLIEKLQKVDGECVVRVWSTRNDIQTENVVVSFEGKDGETGIVWVSDYELGDRTL